MSIPDELSYFLRTPLSPPLTVAGLIDAVVSGPSEPTPKWLQLLLDSDKRALKAMWTLKPWPPWRT